MKKFISEFIGTCLFVLIGCGTTVATNVLIGVMGLTVPIGFTMLMSALAFSTILTVMYYVFSEVSGGHFNPAVSLAVFIDGGFNKVKDLIGYICIQLMGGLTGASLVWLLTGQKNILGESGYDLASPLLIEMMPVIIIELILTAIFVLVFLTVRNKRNSNLASDSIIIGVAFFSIYLFSIPFTGGGINPAKSFGPAIIMLGDTLVQFPVFFLTPLIGSAIGAGVYKTIIKEKELVD